MRLWSKAAAIAAIGAIPTMMLGLVSTPAQGHGSMQTPLSRSATCYAEGPEAPKSEACKAAVAASGSQAFYDWHEVNIANAAGKHREIIPDGKLCSAGRDKYKGLDIPRSDWPATNLNSGADYTFLFRGTAPHKGTFELYITNDNYDPNQPLKWSDLESSPFLSITDPAMQDGNYVLPGKLPAKSGRHLIYAIWQRSDSPEAFYSCSDVVFGEETNAAVAPNAPAKPQNPAPPVTDNEAPQPVSPLPIDHSDHSTVPQSSPAAARAGDDSQLPRTGSATAVILASGIALVGIGIVVTLAVRRRYLARHAAT